LAVGAVAGKQNQGRRNGNADALPSLGVVLLLFSLHDISPWWVSTSCSAGNGRTGRRIVSSHCQLFSASS
jgi:hypothetical protein